MQGKHWLKEVQDATTEWRDETIEGETTPRTQAVHTAVEAAEVADVLVKGETYSPDAMLDLDAARTELGDVVVAHLGTVDMLGLDAGKLLGSVDGVPHTEDPLDNAVMMQFVAIKLSSRVSSDATDIIVRKYAGDVLAYAELLAGRLDSDLEECVDAALEKNGARDWEGWQGE